MVNLIVQHSLRYRHNKTKQNEKKTRTFFFLFTRKQNTSWHTITFNAKGYYRACTQNMQSGNIPGCHWGCTEYKMNIQSSNISNRGHSLDTALILRSVRQLTARSIVKMLKFIELSSRLYCFPRIFCK